MQAARRTGVVASEVARFDALAARWWDPGGPMRPLHAMNPARVDWIHSRIHARFAGPLRLLDVGCGAGLAAESLAERGHEVLGIDAAGEALTVARAHAAGRGLPLAYRDAVADDLLSEPTRFQAITALEVIEHVADPAEFIATLARLLTPGGLLFVSTINRTPRAFVTAKLGAEYVLRLLPVGTHDFRKFVTPAELGGYMRVAGLRLADVAGLAPDIVRGGWRAGRHTGVNYIAMAQG
jgi:2-polyprenyl-6-hydroxyphenyl methylase / 3-demethylubiquinone-9 3-methyltransferase